MDSRTTPDVPSASKPTAAAIRLMVGILIVMALLAVYANVQRARRGKIETVEIKMVSPVPSPAPAATP